MCELTELISGQELVSEVVIRPYDVWILQA